MKSIKYVLLSLIAIAVSGLIWLSKLTPVRSQATVLYFTLIFVAGLGLGFSIKRNKTGSVSS